MNIVNPERYQRLIQEAQEAGFSGWDFSWLDGRMHQEEPPWDYASLVKAYFADTVSLLDMGTGGGELLASLAPLPPETQATETYPPNQPIAEARLGALGVRVHRTVEEQPLPFDDRAFDLVINRHDSYNPHEVCRVLEPGGRFFTQQVGGLDNLELNQVLEDRLSFPFTQWGLAAALTGLYEAGFAVERAKKAALASTFMDIGAVVYYLKAIPWQVADFGPDTHRQGLIQLHNIIEKQGQFAATAHRFLIIARRPEAPA
jgi:SAM-dependent methyltransferase